MYRKHYLGSFGLGKKKLQYFIVHRSSYYGIAVEEEKSEDKECQMIWFTEEREQAYSLANKMLENEVSLTHIEDVLDDLVC